MPAIAAWTLVVAGRAEVLPPTTTTEPFITVWEFTGATTLVLNMNGSTNINIDWGDGSSIEVFSGTNPSHAFAAAGSYNIQVSCDATSPEDFGRFRLGNSGQASLLKEVVQWGTGVWSNLEAAFQGATNCAFTATDYPLIAPTATTASYMFQNCLALTDPDFSNWDVSGLTDLSAMFITARSFNGNISTWDVGNVTNMDKMFYRANAFNGDISSWNVSAVTNFSGMFREATVFNADLSGWQTGAAVNMSSMFQDAKAFNANISSWNVSNVTNLAHCFSGASNFNSPLDSWDVAGVTLFVNTFNSAIAFNQPLNSWDVSSATTLQNMFYACTSFNQDLNNWDVSGVTNFVSTFNRAFVFNGDISTWDVSAGTDFTEMFRKAFAFEGDLASWNLANATTTQQMFQETDLFNADISGWNTSNVTTMHYMFSLAKAFNQQLNSWDVSSVTTFAGMFSNALAFNQPLNDWDVSNATNLAQMFSQAPVFNQPLNNWDVSNVTNLTSTFLSAPAFNQDLDNWDVSNVTSFESTFNRAVAFNGNISNWNTSAATTMSNMFHRAYAFNGDISGWDVSNVTSLNSMFRDAFAFNQPLSGWDVSQVTDMTNLFVSASSFDQDLSDWAWAPSVNTPNLLLNVALSPHYYDALLLSLADAHPAGMQLVSNSKCSDFPEVLAARTQLQAELPTFSDGGVVAGNLDQTAITPTGGTTLTTAGTVDRYGTRNTDAGLTIYGDEVSPSDWTAPLVVTRAPDASAWPIGLSGVLGSHGGQSITALGFCLNTTGNPTTADDTLEVSPVLGAFTADLSGLLPTTTYYVRAFATNALGTDYGQSFEFTTPAFACGLSTVEFDGHAYLTTEIGSQCWFAENLQTTIFADVDETPIPTSTSWSTTTTPARTLYNEGGPSDEVTLAQNGRLYNFYAVADPKGICPSGWHVPSSAEWVTLQSTIEAVPLNVAQALMNRPTDEPSWMGTNDVGFNGAPSGWREPNGSFIMQSAKTAWWTSTPSGGGAIDRVLSPEGLLGYSPGATFALSVRCLQD